MQEHKKQFTKLIIDVLRAHYGQMMPFPMPREISKDLYFWVNEKRSELEAQFEEIQAKAGKETSDIYTAFLDKFNNGDRHSPEIMEAFDKTTYPEISKMIWNREAYEDAIWDIIIKTI